MFSRQHLRVFTLMTIFLALVQANWFDSNLFHRREVEKKAVLSDINSVATSLLGTGSGTATTDASSSTGTTTVKSTAASSTPSSTPTSTPSTSSSSTPTESSSSRTKDSTSSSDTPTPKPTPTPSTSPTPSVGVVTVTTAVSGSVITSLSSSTYTTSSPKATGTAALSTNETSSSSMSPKTKSTVIGVVVGVGGAIVLAGLFIVAWRIWGRRKNEDESDGLMGFRSGSAGHEKSNSASGAGPANPFQSTLENYHNPAKQVNASSNF